MENKIGGNENEAQSGFRQKLTVKGPTVRGAKEALTKPLEEFFERFSAFSRL
ncbi:hypothetical protein [Pseudooceanicola nitratireducens]|uniref:hypothetical protein n=1 Tax=Pseudooceanicola nitratireducens TaxID=517719 RepID=UPI00334199C6